MISSHMTFVTNGHPSSFAAMQYGVWLASMLNASVTLLGVVETSDIRHPVRTLVDKIGELLEESRVPYTVEILEGSAEDLSVQFANQRHELLVFGSFGRPLLRKWLQGSSFRHVLADAVAPIIYVPVARIPLRHMLVCLGGLGYGLTVENLAIDIARVVQADMTLLHVVPPINLDYPAAREVHIHRDHLVNTDTLPGKILREALDLAQKADLSAQVKVRHGSVIQEILDEIRSGDYDMVCLGSPYSTHGLRHLFTPNVTAEIAEAAQCPILTARYEEGTNS